MMWIFDSIKQKTPLNRATPEVAFGDVQHRRMMFRSSL